MLTLSVRRVGVEPPERPGARPAGVRGERCTRRGGGRSASRAPRRRDESGEGTVGTMRSLDGRAGSRRTARPTVTVDADETPLNGGHLLSRPAHAPGPRGARRPMCARAADGSVREQVPSACGRPIQDSSPGGGARLLSAGPTIAGAGALGSVEGRVGVVDSRTAPCVGTVAPRRPFLHRGGQRAPRSRGRIAKGDVSPPEAPPAWSSGTAAGCTTAA